MKFTLFILTALLLLVVPGCDKNEIIEEKIVVSNGSVLTLTASMPDDGTTQTRMALTQDGKNIKLTWEEGDQLQLCFIQGENKEKQTVEVKNISSDGKKADFDINVPVSFAPGTFDLYGVYGGQGLDDANPSIAVLPDKPWQTYTGLGGVQSRDDVMMKFEATGLAVGAPAASVQFQHIGSLFCVKLKNGATGTWNGIKSLRLTASTDGWAYNNNADEAVRYDLQGGLFVSGSLTNSALFFENHLKNMAVDEITEFWAWYPPAPDINWPELRLEVYNAELVKIASSANSKAARVAPTATGKAYYFYAVWDGSTLKFTDDTFTPPPSIDDLITTGDLMHAASGSDFIGIIYSKGDGKVYYNAAQTNGIWMGETDLGAGTEARITIDGNGLPHVVYRSTDNKIAYLKYTGTAWSPVIHIESMDTGGCSKPDIEVDGSGYAHITYTDTKGSAGDMWDRDDIMYTVNSSGDFIRTLIFHGYYENLGGSTYAGHYYNKGSFITLDGVGNYYIMAHHVDYYRWTVPADQNYNVVIKSGTGASGGTATSYNSDQYDIYDLEFNGIDVLALYKNANVNCTATIAVVGATAFFTSLQNIETAVVPHSLSATSTVTKIVGWTTSGENRLFTKYNTFENTEPVEVKSGTKIGSVNVGGIFYSVYTDNADSKIKIKPVTTGD